MLAPRWFRFRLGPYLRRERDKRAYHKLFRAEPNTSKAERAVRLLTLPRRAEPSSVHIAPSESGVYVFEGMHGCFSDFRGYHAFIRDEFVRALRPEYVPRAEGAPFVAVHVRRGDFTVPTTDSELRSGKHNYRVPMEWYVEALRALRAAVARPLQAQVFSDADEVELRPLLQEPTTRMVRLPSAASELLLMSTSRALIASGSTFSMWACFLGQLPSIWYPGQRRELMRVEQQPAIEPEWAGGPLPDRFREGVKAD